MGQSAGKIEENGKTPIDYDIDYYYDEALFLNGTKNCSIYLNDYCEPPEDYENRMLDHIFPDQYEWILIGAHLIIFVIGLVGNTLVGIAVFRNSSMRTVTNYFIVNLAVADFMVILFCLPPTVAWDVTQTWWLGTTMCKIVLYFQTVSVSVSVLTLTVISTERWYAICSPLRFKATTSRAKRLILVIWIVSLVVDIPELIVLEAKPRDFPVETVYFTQCAPTWSTESDMIYIILRILILYLFPLVFMSIAYFQIVRVLWSSPSMFVERRAAAYSYNGGYSVNNHRQPVESSAHLMTPMIRSTRASLTQVTAIDNQLRSRRKAAKMLCAVVIFFALCYLPVHVYSIIGLIVVLPQKDYLAYIVMISHFLCYANSAMNPIIYNFMSEKFRKEFLRAFGLRRLRNDGRRFQSRFSVPGSRNSFETENHATAHTRRTEQSQIPMMTLRASRDKRIRKQHTPVTPV